MIQHASLHIRCHRRGNTCFASRIARIAISLWSALVVVSTAGVAISETSRPSIPEIMPVSAIKTGQKGYGLTVFQGFKIERFEVEVIDVMYNFIPNQNIILMKVDHPIVREAGVIGGMSGSPIFIDGKLVGALAYGWRFAKEPICGVTPIEDMLALAKRTLKGPPSSGTHSFTSNPVSSAFSSPMFSSGLSTVHSARWWTDRRILTMARDANNPSTEQRPSSVPEPLTKLAMPLNIAGLSAKTSDVAHALFSEYGIEPLAAGGTGKAEGPHTFEPGSSIGVQFVRGDIAMTATGTVTWAAQHHVLGFGHSMFNAGEIYLPTVSARIHHSLAALSRSFKLSSPARVIGSLVQDRQAGIAANTSLNAPMIPATITLRVGEEQFVYRVELASHRILSARLASIVASGAITQAISDIADVSVKMKTKLEIKGYPAITIDEDFYSREGLAATGIPFAQGFRAIDAILNNPFQPAVIERISVDIGLNFINDVVEITRIRVDDNYVEPGERLRLFVTFKPYNGTEYEKAYDLEIPASLASSVVQLEVAGGIQVPYEFARPETFKQLLELLPKDYPARAIVVSLYVPSKSLKVNGQLLNDLPFSIADALDTASDSRPLEQFATAVRKVHHTQRFVLGKTDIRLRVKERGVSP